MLQVSSATPVQVPGLTQVFKIAAGEASAAAIRRRGPYTTLTSVVAWGLGGVPGANPLTPTGVPGINAPQVAGISVGDARTSWPWAATDPSATCGEVEPVVGADDQIGAPSVAGVGLEDPVTVAEEGADPVRLA